ncbi:hypothetical protein BCR42DRAFT_394870 [Absidia repens]|uniref:Uncharacterized protein n=1 Tax=Absidia repens TaxID=90262 RepID=A0A1X2I9Z5_9FUNG|nr:hypothetical protein BCR42DRAFT_394870 [Absidia repens]
MNNQVIHPFQFYPYTTFDPADSDWLTNPDWTFAPIQFGNEEANLNDQYEVNKDNEQEEVDNEEANLNDQDEVNKDNEQDEVDNNSNNDSPDVNVTSTTNYINRTWPMTAEEETPNTCDSKSKHTQPNIWNYTPKNGRYIGIARISYQLNSHQPLSSWRINRLDPKKRDCNIQ